MTPGFQSGQRIGLFGGSFNPAHRGHLHLATTAQHACNLDRVWWMPSPQNPLKPTQPSWKSRAQSVESLSVPHGHTVSDVELKLGTRYTVDLLRKLRRRDPATQYVFLMGADNWAQLPLWKDWRDILALVPVCVVSRPGPDALKARLGQAARQYADARVPETLAHTLPDRPVPAWTFLTAPLDPNSSSAIRATMAVEGRLQNG